MGESEKRQNMDKKESETLELKKSTSELKEAIISIVSILNKHQKGEIIFGIKSNGDIIGQSVNEKTLRDVSKSISDHIEPKIFPKISEIILDIKNVSRLNFLEIIYPIMLMEGLIYVLQMRIN